MYSSDNNNLYDDKIQANQILDLIESLGDEKLTAFFKQMDYPEEEKILYLYQQLKITPKYDQNHKILPVSETDQLAAVNKNGYVIEYIPNPSEKVQLDAVNENGFAIQYIQNPSEDVQLAAVNEDGNAIKHIIKKGIIPSEDVQLAAVNEYGPAIRYIIKKGIIPSEDVQLAAVNKYGRAIQYIENPSEKIKQLHNIENPSEKIKQLRNIFLFARDKGIENV